MANDKKTCKVCDLNDGCIIFSCTSCERDMCPNTYGYYRAGIDITRHYCMLCYLDDFVVYKYTKCIYKPNMYGKIYVSHKGSNFCRFIINEDWLKECEMDLTFESGEYHKLSIDKLHYLTNKSSDNIARKLHYLATKARKSSNNMVEKLEKYAKIHGNTE